MKYKGDFNSLWRQNKTDHTMHGEENSEKSKQTEEIVLNGQFCGLSKLYYISLQNNFEQSVGTTAVIPTFLLKIGRYTNRAKYLNGRVR